MVCSNVTKEDWFHNCLAIQFLVCHDYLHMVQKKKEELLNAGIQQKPFGTASVEIVFEDENDGRVMLH